MIMSVPSYKTLIKSNACYDYECPELQKTNKKLCML